MGLKIVLVKPNIFARKGFDLLNRIYPPVGLAYLASALIHAGHEAEILDMVAEAPDKKWDYRGEHVSYGMDDDDLLKRVGESRPDIVGVTGFTSQHLRLVEISTAIKKAHPQIVLVIGGIHATAMPELVMRETSADYLIRGDGERSLVALADCIESGKISDIMGIDGIVCRDGSKTHIQPKLIEKLDIDSYPFPARDLFRNDVYLDRKVPMPIITSRGCPHSCPFCCTHLVHGRRWMFRSPLSVVDEMEVISKEFGYKTITVWDDAFNVQPKRVIEICKEIVRRNLDIFLVISCSVLLNLLTRESLYWMKKAGAVSIALPFEHTDETIRNKIIGKKISDIHFDNVLGWCRELEILTIIYFVIGIPGETEASLSNMAEYVRRNAQKMDAISTHIVTPFPATQFYDECIANGYLKDPQKNGFLDFDGYEGLLNTPEMPASRVNEYNQIINNAFSAARGPGFPAQLVRVAIRKPNAEAVKFINDVYFRSLTASKAV